MLKKVIIRDNYKVFKRVKFTKLYISDATSLILV